uniref:Serine protease K12H4.7 n=1 Tax=Rhabditophanes sp. KR3021 TaxID=114890 RepID=A0AC35TME6_9BILA
MTIIVQNSLLLLIALFAIVECKPAKRQRSLFGRRSGGFKKPTDYKSSKLSQNSGVFVNKVDHFNSFNKQTYKQTYWYNTDHYVAGGPAFLMMGGEAAEDDFWTTDDNLQFGVLAKNANAAMFTLEHRYYGTSLPVSDLSTGNLKYLSSRQALADAAAFINSMNANPQFGLSNNTKWVTLGGSYAGSLSAWMREMYPDLVHAAVASSAPITAVIDFYQGFNMVSQGLNNYNPKCASDVSAGFAAVREFIATPQGQQNVKKAFGLCDDWSTLSDDDIQFFWNNFIQQYYEILQYGGLNYNALRAVQNIENLCAFHLRSDSSPFQNLVDAATWVESMEFGGDCIDVNYQEYIGFLNSTDFGQDTSDSRAWLYQCCTEFGFFQTTDQTASSFWGFVIDIEWAAKQCQIVFGLPQNSLDKGVAKTNTYYGAVDKFRGSRVIFSNGLQDPWHALGMLSSSNNKNYPVVMANGAHCEEMYEADETDPAPLTEGRKKIADKLTEYLAAN